MSQEIEITTTKRTTMLRIIYLIEVQCKRGSFKRAWKSTTTGLTREEISYCKTNVKARIGLTQSGTNNL